MTTTVPTAGDEERLVARLRDGIVVQQAGPSVLIGTPDFAATVALMREAADRLESLSTVERERDELAEKARIVGDMWNKESDALSASNAEAERLREALTPFAQFAERIIRDHPGWDHDTFVFSGAEIGFAPFRRAARALQGSAKQ